ncbi:MarR family winged helix-turn-helix transcriptional regulator [Streptomyces sp. NPDC000941]
MNQLGRHLGLDKSSITGLVDRAQRRGLVTRAVSAVDRRSYQVSITDAGRQLAEQVAAQFAERIERSVAPLPESDRKRLSQLATRIVTADAHGRGVDLRTTRCAPAGPGAGARTRGGPGRPVGRPRWPGGVGSGRRGRREDVNALRHGCAVIRWCRGR